MEKRLDSIKILHISTEKLFRGGERQLAWLHEGLLKEGVQSFLLYKKRSGLGEREIPQSAFHGAGTIVDIIGLAGILRTCKRINPDIIHCHDSCAFSLGSVVSSLQNRRLCVTKRTVNPIRPTFFNKWKYAGCDAIVAISTAVSALCEKITAGNPKVSVIHDGVEWDNQLLSREKSREQLGIRKDAFVIGTVGYFTTEKNLPMLLSLAESLKLTHPAVVILCIGFIPDKNRAGLKAAPNIVLTGTVNDAVQYYPAFDMYVSTAVREGLGSALLDAVVRDIPAIALDSGGARDIYPSDSQLLVKQGEEAGFIRAVKRGINTYEELTDQAKILGSNTRKSFPLSKMISKHIDLYADIHRKTDH